MVNSIDMAVTPSETTGNNAPDGGGAVVKKHLTNDQRNTILQALLARSDQKKLNHY